MKGLKLYGIIGLIVLIVAEVLLFLKVRLVAAYFTPIAWTAYILFIDSVIFKRKGESLLSTRPGELRYLLPLSVLFWMVYEAYNLYMRNWYYINLPSNLFVRLFDYVWAYSTITPAILLTAELLETFPLFNKFRIGKRVLKPSFLYTSLVIGIIFLVAPVLMPSNIAIYLWAPVWLGFIFLLDPLNYWTKQGSLFRDLERGQMGRILSLFVAGYICGFLWEFWNYWSYAKWIYTVPFTQNIKIFEMPILGFTGFGPFAWACHVTYCWGKAVVRKIFLSVRPPTFKNEQSLK